MPKFVALTTFPYLTRHIPVNERVEIEDPRLAGLLLKLGKIREVKPEDEERPPAAPSKKASKKAAAAAAAAEQNPPASAPAPAPALALAAADTPAPAPEQGHAVGFMTTAGFGGHASTDSAPPDPGQNETPPQTGENG